MSLTGKVLLSITPCFSLASPAPWGLSAIPIQATAWFFLPILRVCYFSTFCFSLPRRPNHRQRCDLERLSGPVLNPCSLQAHRRYRGREARNGKKRKPSGRNFKMEESSKIAIKNHRQYGSFPEEQSAWSKKVLNVCSVFSFRGFIFRE